jgi:ribosomal protein S18 acetylase RimI-like enzyme
VPYGLPNISCVGWPVAVPCAGHAGLGFREARASDADAVLAHFRRMQPADLRLRFCATVSDASLRTHVSRIWDRPGLVLAAHDGPLWDGPFHAAGPVRGLAEFCVSGEVAELGITVDGTLRRRGVGTWLVRTAAALLAPRGVRRIVAFTMPENMAMIGLGRTSGARIVNALGDVEIVFDVEPLRRAYVARRLAAATASDIRRGFQRSA